ncbi:MAG: CHAT domain-containing protein [Myxococcota bacterium]
MARFWWVIGRALPAAAAAVAVVMAVALACVRSVGGCPDEDDARCVTAEEIFSRPVVRRDTPPPGRIPPPHVRVEYAGCEAVIETPEAEIQCVYTPGTELRLWVEHNREHAPTVTVFGDGDWSLTGTYTRDEEFGQGYRLALAEPGLRAVIVHPREGPGWQLPLRVVSELPRSQQRHREDFLAQTLELERQLVQSYDEDTLAQLERLMARASSQGLLSDAVKVGMAVSFHVGGGGQRPGDAQRLLERLVPMAERFPLGRAAVSIYLAHVRLTRGKLVEAARLYRSGGRFAVRVDDIGLQLDALPPYAALLAELGYFEAAAYWAGVARKVAKRARRPHDLALSLDVVARAGLRLLQAHRLHEDPEPHFREVLRMYAPKGALHGIREPAGARLGLAELALLRHDADGALQHLDRLRAEGLTRDEQTRAQMLRVRAMLVTAAPVDAQRLRAALDRLDAWAERAVTPEVRWQAMVVRGMIYERLGELEHARRAYERSEQQLDRLLSLVALGVPGGFGVAGRDEGTQRLLSLLVEQGQLDAAVCVARQSQARLGRMGTVLRGLDWGSTESLRVEIERYQELRRTLEQRAQNDAERLTTVEHERAQFDAKRSREQLDQLALEILSRGGASHVGRPRCDELSARQVGELLLVLVPHDDALRVLVVDGRGTEHYLLDGYSDVADSVDPVWFSELLLGPIRERVASASRVRVLASGRAMAIDVHALPWVRDRAREERVPLAMIVPVVYGLEIGPTERLGEDTDTRRALLLADDWAQGAAEEIEEVRRNLLGLGWSAESVRTRDLSSRGIVGQLARVDLFHYAGHAYYAEVATDVPRSRDGDDERLRLWPPYSGGAASVPSYIPLGELGRFTAPDVLMMDRVPRTVVLMGCATGVIDQRQAHGGFSLAAAFLGAGAQAVVASTRQVDGTEAALVGRALYGGIVPLPSLGVEPGRWMSDALRRARQQGLPERAVADYRLFVP